MKKISISLSKYDNQQGKCDPFLTLEATEEEIAKVNKIFEGPGARLSVTGFYRYTYELNGKQEIYSVSPALFDHLEKHTT